MDVIKVYHDFVIHMIIVVVITIIAGMAHSSPTVLGRGCGDGDDFINVTGNHMLGAGASFTDNCSGLLDSDATNFFITGDNFFVNFDLVHGFVAHVLSLVHVLGLSCFEGIGLFLFASFLSLFLIFATTHTHFLCDSLIK